jgi:hypothetical protein
MHPLISIVSNPAPVPADAPVTWTGEPPAEEEARVIWEALAGARPLGYAALVERVGERLFRRDLETFGVSADVGFFRPFYLAHARRLIGALAGTRLRIGGAA